MVWRQSTSQRTGFGRSCLAWAFFCRLPFLPLQPLFLVGRAEPPGRRVLPALASPARLYLCNGHYNRTPDLGKGVMWWDVWDLARHTILDAKVLDRNVTWLSKHKDTS